MDKREMIQKIREYYKLERNVDFARFFGISEPTAHAQAKAGTLNFEQIYEKCPEISAEWLLSQGEGPMLKNERIQMYIKENEDLFLGATPRSPYVQDSKSLEEALSALQREQDALGKMQEALSRSQAQVSDLIDILKEKEK